MYKFLKNFAKEKVKTPLHYASEYYTDKQPLGETKYHSFSSSKEAEEEYQQTHKNKNKLNSIIDLTTKSLQLEYTKKLKYLNLHLKIIFIFSVLIIINSIINLKALGFSELSVSMIILSSISATIVVVLLFNIQTNVLLDLYGYSSFYLFSMFESCILIALYVLKILDFIMSMNNKGKNKNNPFGYYFNIILNIIIFIGMIILIKYTLVSFYEAFNVLILKQKTTVQKQFEINEKGTGKGERIQFIDEHDKVNESSDRFMNITENKIDTFDNLKTE